MHQCDPSPQQHHSHHPLSSYGVPFSSSTEPSIFKERHSAVAMNSLRGGGGDVRSGIMLSPTAINADSHYISPLGNYRSSYSDHSYHQPHHYSSTTPNPRTAGGGGTTATELSHSYDRSILPSARPPQALPTTTIAPGSATMLAPSTLRSEVVGLGLEWQGLLLSIREGGAHHRTPHRTASGGDGRGIDSSGIGKFTSHHHSSYSSAFSHLNSVRMLCMKRDRLLAVGREIERRERGVTINAPSMMMTSKADGLFGAASSHYSNKTAHALSLQSPQLDRNAELLDACSPLRFSNISAILDATPLPQHPFDDSRNHLPSPSVFPSYLERELAAIREMCAVIGAEMKEHEDRLLEVMGVSPTRTIHAALSASPLPPIQPTYIAPLSTASPTMNAAAVVETSSLSSPQPFTSFSFTTPSFSSGGGVVGGAASAPVPEQSKVDAPSLLAASVPTATSEREGGEGGGASSSLPKYTPLDPNTPASKYQRVERPPFNPATYRATDMPSSYYALTQRNREREARLRAREEQGDGGRSGSGSGGGASEALIAATLSTAPPSSSGNANGNANVGSDRAAPPSTAAATADGGVKASAAKHSSAGDTPQLSLLRTPTTATVEAKKEEKATVEAKKEEKAPPAFAANANAGAETSLVNTREDAKSGNVGGRSSVVPNIVAEPSSLTEDVVADHDAADAKGVAHNPPHLSGGSGGAVHRQYSFNENDYMSSQAHVDDDANTNTTVDSNGNNGANNNGDASSRHGGKESATSTPTLPLQEPPSSSSPPVTASSMTHSSSPAAAPPSTSEMESGRNSATALALGEEDETPKPPRKKQVSILAPTDDALLQSTSHSPSFSSFSKEGSLGASDEGKSVGGGGGSQPPSGTAVVEALGTPNDYAANFEKRLQLYCEGLVSEGLWTVHGGNGSGNGGGASSSPSPARQRRYYANKQTKETVWDLAKKMRSEFIDMCADSLLRRKVWALVTPAEAKGGGGTTPKPYYYNKATKETCWDLKKYVESH